MKPSEIKSKEVRCSLFFWALAAISLFCLLGSTALYAAEARYAEAVREMFLAGDWLHPTFNGMRLSPRPLFMHWIMLLGCRMTGVCSEFSLRLPGVLAGLLTLLAVRRLGEKLFSPECGRTAGYLLLGCFGFLFWSRSATAEMWNTCVIAVGILWFYELREKPGFRNIFTLTMFFLLGTQFKGVFAALALGVLLLPALLNRDFRARLRIGRTLAALLLALLLFGALKYMLSGSARIAADSLAGGMVWSGRKVFRQPFFYFRELPLLFLPWTLVLFACPAGMLKNWKKQSEPIREMLCGALLMLVLLTFLPWTQGYYALGLLVPLTVCSAAALTCGAGLPAWNDFVIRLMRALAAAAASAGVISLLFLPFWKRILGYHPPLLLLLSIPAIGALALWVLFHAEFDRRNIAGALTGIRQNIAVPVLAADLLCCGFTAVILPQYHLTRTERAFLTGLREKMVKVPSSQMVYWKNPALRFLFYFNRSERLNTAHNAEELAAMLAETPSALWLMTQNTPEEMAYLETELNKLHIPFSAAVPFFQEKLRPVDHIDAVKIAVFRLPGGKKTQDTKAATAAELLRIFPAAPEKAPPQKAGL